MLRGDHRYPRLSEAGGGGGKTGNFYKIQKGPPISPNFLKIVENVSSHQNNYFYKSHKKTCFKKIWLNAKGGTTGNLWLSKEGPCSDNYTPN